MELFSVSWRLICAVHFTSCLTKGCVSMSIKAIPLSANKAQPLLPPQTSVLPSTENYFGRSATNTNVCYHSSIAMALVLNVAEGKNRKPFSHRKIALCAYISTEDKMINRNSYLIKKKPFAFVLGFYCFEETPWKTPNWGWFMVSEL